MSDLSFHNLKFSPIFSHNSGDLMNAQGIIGRKFGRPESARASCGMV